MMKFPCGYDFTNQNLDKKTEYIHGSIGVHRHINVMLKNKVKKKKKVTSEGICPIKKDRFS